MSTTLSMPALEALIDARAEAKLEARLIALGLVKPPPAPHVRKPFSALNPMQRDRVLQFLPEQPGHAATVLNQLDAVCLPSDLEAKVADKCVGTIASTGLGESFPIAVWHAFNETCRPPSALHWQSEREGVRGFIALMARMALGPQRDANGSIDPVHVEGFYDEGRNAIRHLERARIRLDPGDMDRVDRDVVEKALRELKKRNRLVWNRAIRAEAWGPVLDPKVQEGVTP